MAAPDRGCTTDRLEIPSVVLLLDIDGREDIPYHAMMGESYLSAGHGDLKIGPTNRSDIVGYRFTLDFGSDLEALAIVGLADGEAVEMFARGEMLLISGAAHATDDGAPVFAIAPNDPIRWTYHLCPESHRDRMPTCPMPTAPVAGDPSWNAHRDSWMIKDPDTLMSIEHQPTGWHLLDGLTDVAATTPSWN